MYRPNDLIVEFPIPLFLLISAKHHCEGFADKTILLSMMNIAFLTSLTADGLTPVLYVIVTMI